MRLACVIVVCLMCGSSVAEESWIALHGFIGLRAARVEASRSFFDGGYGRMAIGGVGTESEFVASIQWALEIRAHESIRLVIHGAADSLDGSPSMHQAGLIQAYLEADPVLGAGVSLRARAGLFFAPGSLEVSGPLWRPRNTQELSTLNTWLAEELRLEGIDLQLGVPLGSLELEIGGNVFVGADTAGALLAWRGWAAHDRPSRLGETLPLPPIESLGPAGFFSGQLDAGTEPLAELDDRYGFSARARLSWPRRWLIQVEHFDNRGDGLLYEGQYAWKTVFERYGASLVMGKGFRLVAEGIDGRTMMGPPIFPADLDFRSAYILLEWRRGAWRSALRIEDFKTTELDDGYAERNDEVGDGWSLSLRRRFKSGFELGLDWRRLEVERADTPRFDGDQIMLEFAWRGKI